MAQCVLTCRIPLVHNRNTTDQNLHLDRKMPIKLCPYLCFNDQLNVVHLASYQINPIKNLLGTPLQC